jgi:hypothetical protein
LGYLFRCSGYEFPHGLDQSFLGFGPFLWSGHSFFGWRYSFPLGFGHSLLLCFEVDGVHLLLDVEYSFLQAGHSEEKNFPPGSSWLTDRNIKTHRHQRMSAFFQPAGRSADRQLMDSWNRVMKNDRNEDVTTVQGM